MSNVIQKFINNQVNIQYIYGGMTDGEISDRITEHIQNKEPEQCNNSWEYVHVIKYSLIGNFTDDKENIINLQEYFINKLTRLFNTKCVNNKNMGEINLTNDSNKIYFYIFYKLYDPEDL